MAKERKERATHRSHSAGQELRRGSTCKPTSCEIEDSPTDSRATFSSSVSSPPPNRGRCRDPSSKRESCHPPILSTATEAYRRELPGKKRIVHRFNAIVAFLDFGCSVLVAREISFEWFPLSIFGNEKRLARRLRIYYVQAVQPVHRCWLKNARNWERKERSERKDRFVRFARHRNWE